MANVRSATVIQCQPGGEEIPPPKVPAGGVPPVEGAEAEGWFWCCRKVGHACGALANCLLGSYLCVTECYYCRKFDPLSYCLTACCCPDSSGATRGDGKNPADAKGATEPGGHHRATTGFEQYSARARDPIPAYVG